MSTRTFNDASTVPAEWQEGDVILDLYEVKQIHSGGGMGLVYRVHHRGWNVDLAVKSPRANFFQTEQQKENFTRECETWIGLGLHPHIVSCHYVRTLGGMPRVFAEYVEGGSLKDWIESKKLYEGGEQETLKRILDIAIQMAWGLHYAHEQGLIHQDVKPANVLMTPDGTAKVSDFGLAKARAATGETIAAGVGGSILVSTGGMTPAYCSPEQANKQPLSRRTDIWSWGLSVLEMFAGGIFWRAGQVAADALESYAEQGAAEKTIPPMPAGLLKLLKHCFQQQPEKRPESMGEVAEGLRRIYHDCFGTDYRRAEPKPVTLLADALNNRGVSMLDLERKEEAEKLFAEALKSDPHHLDANYNLGLVRWRTGRITDVGLVSQFEEVRKTRGQDWRADFVLGLVHVERGDMESAVTALEKAAKTSAQPDIQASLCQARNLVHNSARCVRTFEGHTGGVNSVSLSADGRWALSGSSDFMLRLWDVTTGQCVRTFEGLTEPVNSGSLSADGHWALSGSGWSIGSHRNQATIRLWEVTTGRCVRTFEGHTGPVRSVKLSADGCWALSGSGDKTLRLWEVATGRCVRTFEGLSDYVNPVSLSADGRWILLGSGNQLRLWEAATGRCVQTFEGHSSLITSVNLSADGRWALSGDAQCRGSDNTIRLWEVATGRCVRTFKGYANSVSLSADGHWVLSGSDDTTLLLWEVASGRCVRTFEGHTGPVRSVSLSADGRWALSGSEDHTLRLWDIALLVADRLNLKSPARLSPVKSTEKAMKSAGRFEQLLTEAQIALHSDRYAHAHQILCEARSIPGYERHMHALQTWKSQVRGCARSNFRGAWCARTFAGFSNQGWLWSVSLSADGRWALLGSDDNTLRLWEVATGRCVRLFEGHSAGVTSVCLSADGRWALSGSEDHTLRLWAVGTGRCLQTFAGHTTEWINSVCLSADSRWALSESDDNTLRLWEVATGRCMRLFEGHTEPVSSVSLSADSCWALSGSGDDTLRLWELVTGRCVRIFEGHTAWVYSVSLSADGRLALSGSADNTLRLWEVATGRCMRTLEGHTSAVNSVSLSADGRLALSGSADNTLRLWDVATGRCVGTLEGHTDMILSVCLSADGCRALSGSADKTVRLWELDWDFEVCEPLDWDEGARPYLAAFLAVRTPYAADLPKDREPSEQEIVLALTRRGKPSWTDEDFKNLIETLVCAGYGWLRPEGVRRKLVEMATGVG